MIALTTTLRRLELDLESASTTPLDIVVSFRDKRAENADAFGTQLSVSNGTSDVNICDRPAAGVIRVIETISVFNPTGNDPETVRIYYDENGTEFTIAKFDLMGGEHMYYDHAYGWKSLNYQGNFKMGA